jgi:hypothetical protein
MPAPVRPPVAQSKINQPEIDVMGDNDTIRNSIRRDAVSRLRADNPDWTYEKAHNEVRRTQPHLFGIALNRTNPEPAFVQAPPPSAKDEERRELVRNSKEKFGLTEGEAWAWVKRRRPDLFIVLNSQRLPDPVDEAMCVAGAAARDPDLAQKRREALAQYRSKNPKASFSDAWVWLRSAHPELVNYGSINPV